MVTKPYTFTDDTTALPEEVNINFDQLYDFVENLINATDYNSGAFNSATLNAAITDIGSANKVLYIPAGTWTISANVTFPANVYVKFAQGAVLSNASNTVTFNGGTNAWMLKSQTLDGAGTFTFAANSIPYVTPYMFGAVGDDSTDDTTAFQRALATAFPLVKFSALTHKITAQLEMSTGGQLLEGSPKTCWLKAYNMTNTSIIKMSGSSTKLKRFAVDGQGLTGVIGIGIYNDTQNTFNHHLEDITVWDCQSYGILGHQNTGSYYGTNDCWIINSSVYYCGTGMDFRHPVVRTSGCFISNCDVVGLNASVNSKIILDGMIFSTNEKDLYVREAEVSGNGVWFENATDLMIEGYARVIIDLAGAHYHSLDVTNTNTIDFSAVTAGYAKLHGHIPSDSEQININATQNMTLDIYNLYDAKAGTVNGTINRKNTTRIMVEDLTPVIGLSGVYGANADLTLPNKMFTYNPKYIKVVVGGTVAGGETLTLYGGAGFFDYGSANSITKTFTATGTTWLTEEERANLYYAGKNGTYRRICWFKAKTDQSSTSATITVTFYGDAE